MATGGSFFYQVAANVQWCIRISKRAPFHLFTWVTALLSLTPVKTADALSHVGKINEPFSPFSPDLNELNPSHYFKLSNVNSLNEANYIILALGQQQIRGYLYSSHILKMISTENNQIYFSGPQRVNCSEYTISLSDLYCYDARYCATEIRFNEGPATCLSLDSPENQAIIAQYQQNQAAAREANKRMALIKNYLPGYKQLQVNYSQSIEKDDALQTTKILHQLLKSTKAFLRKNPLNNSTHLIKALNGQIPLIKTLTQTTAPGLPLNRLALQLNPAAEIMNEFNLLFKDQVDDLKKQQGILKERVANHSSLGVSQRAKHTPKLILKDKRSPNHSPKKIFIAEHGFFFKKSSHPVNYNDLRQGIRKALQNTKHCIIAFK